MAGTGTTCPPSKITDADLTTCMNLMSAVSYRAKMNDFDQNDCVGRIRKRMSDNGWHTWYYKNSGGAITACCFFQYMRTHNNNYAMCVGFDTNAFPMQSDQNCATFVNTVAGGGNGDGLLYDCIKNVLNVKLVNIVKIPLTGAASIYNTRLDTLFVYMQNNPTNNWSLVQDGTFNSAFWGGNNLVLWQLKVN
jgi:hypothetical protein